MIIWYLSKTGESLVTPGAPDVVVLSGQDAPVVAWPSRESHDRGERVHEATVPGGVVHEMVDESGQPLEDRMVELNHQQQSGLEVKRDLVTAPIPTQAIERDILVKLQAACRYFGPMYLIGKCKAEARAVEYIREKLHRLKETIH